MDLATDHRGHDGPQWTPSSHTCAISSASLFIPSTAGMTDRQRHNSMSRVSIPKYLNSSNLDAGTTSLIFMMNKQDGPSWLQRSVTHSVTLYLVRLLHLPSAAALECHLRTVTGTTNRHKLRRWYFSVFLAQKPPHSSFRQISCK